MISVRKVNNRPLNFLERIYLVEIARGLAVTARHFFANLLGRRSLTVPYPERRIPAAGNSASRTRHRLKARPDGSPRCVACFLCQTACPARCITIEAAEYPGKPVEKYPASFSVDLSRCVMCGMCVEACPEDAIAMDTGELPGGAASRQELKLDKEDLLRRVPGETPARGAANRLAEGPGGER